jgi:hypothetical protein
MWLMSDTGGVVVALLIVLAVWYDSARLAA